MLRTPADLGSRLVGQSSQKPAPLPSTRPPPTTFVVFFTLCFASFGETGSESNRRECVIKSVINSVVNSVLSCVVYGTKTKASHAVESVRVLYAGQASKRAALRFLLRLIHISDESCFREIGFGIFL